MGKEIYYKYSWKYKKVNLKDNKNQWNKSLVFGKSNNLTNAARLTKKRE